MPKTRVLIFTNSFRSGGSERQAVQLAMRLDRSRFEPRIACLQKDGWLLDELDGPLKEVEEFRLDGSFFNATTKAGTNGIKGTLYEFLRNDKLDARNFFGSRRDILIQFLIEAVVITSIGGVMGVAAGFALAFVLAKAMGFPLLFSVGSAVLGVSVSSAVGIASGLWPAWKAAGLDPIEALRAE